MGSKKRRRKRRLIEVIGAPPGTIAVDAQSPKSVIRVMAYGPEGFTEETLKNLDALPAYLEKWPVTWVNIDGLGDQNTITRLRDMFDLHALAVEDVLSLHHRPKLDRYENHMFLVLRMLESGMPVQFEQLSIFFGDRYVLTLQEHPGDSLDPIRARIREGTAKIRTLGSDYLAYSLMDAVIDTYFPRLDQISDRIEDVEDEVVGSPRPEVVAAIHEIKRDVLNMRRVLFPMRETVNSMIRDSGRLISDNTRVYLRDCYDHVVHLLDLLENYREITSGLLDIYLSSVSNRMNEIMKVLTIIATVFIPLTFIAGVYGMNFDPNVSPWNMPELRTYYGYPTVLAIMASIALGLVFYFWRKGWLTSDRHDGKP